MRDLSDVSIGIKTFLRDAQLFTALAGIQKTMPDARIIVADDGEMSEEKDHIYADLIRKGHQIILCEFDKGFGHKSNRIADVLQTPHLLIASDDFDFDPPSVRNGIEDLASVLDWDPNVDIASGRVNHNPYEFTLLDEGSQVIEIPIDEFNAPNDWWYFYYLCDLTVNYNLVRRPVFDAVRWDDGVKIGGGEHLSFFLDCKHAGIKTAYVPGVNIDSQKVLDSSRYRQYRRRASSPERPCYVKRGIKRVTLGNGTIDYDETAHRG